MKKTLLIFSILLFFLSCNSNDDSSVEFDSIGKIVSLDPSECACCGGYFIEINDEVYNYFDNSSLDIDLSLVNLPIDIKLNWEIIGECINEIIDISEMQLIL
jgi:hypothetical protein